MDSQVEVMVVNCVRDKEKADKVWKSGQWKQAYKTNWQTILFMTHAETDVWQIYIAEECNPRSLMMMMII